jgi:hypothetical protein
MIIEPGQSVSSKINSDKLIQFRGGQTYQVSTSFLRNDDTIIESIGTGRAKLICRDSNYVFDVSNRQRVTIRNLHLENIGNPTMALIRGVDCGDITISDNVLRRGQKGISINRYQGKIGKIIISGNLFQENWNYGGKHAAGIYIADSNQDVLVEENVFDQNGYLPQKTQPDIYSHGIYLQSTNLSATVRRNVIFGSSSHGCQHRCGGINEDNVYLLNPIHLSFGHINGAPCYPGGVKGSVQRNLFLGSQSPLARGYAIELGNILKVTINDNLLLGNAASVQAAIKLSIPERVDNPNQLVGILDLTFINNLIEWKGGPFWQDPSYSPSAGGASKLGHLDKSGIKVTNLPDFFQLITNFMAQARLSPRTAAMSLLNPARSMIIGGTPTPPPPPSPTLPKITGITLYDADTDKAIAPLSGTINLPRIGANLNIVVATDSAATVQMSLDGVSKTERNAPYAYGGDNSGDLAPIQIGDGTHSFVASVLSSTGAISDSQSISFSIQSAPTPVEALTRCMDRHDSTFKAASEVAESKVARASYL